MALPVYSSRDVQISWGGITLHGLAPDSFVSFSRNSDLTDEEIGGDGSLSVSVSPDRTGTCTFSLQQNSESNLLLSGVIALQEESKDFKTASLTVVDPSGSVIALLSNCHIKTAPEVSLGSSATGSTKDWVFFCESMRFTATPEGLSGGSSVAEIATRVAAGIETAKTWIA